MLNTTKLIAIAMTILGTALIGLYYFDTDNAETIFKLYFSSNKSFKFENKSEFKISEVARNCFFRSHLHEFYVYSSYWETRYPRLYVRTLILITAKYRNEALTDCYLWYKNELNWNIHHKGVLILKVNALNKKKLMLEAQFKCYPLRNSKDTEVPYAVSFVPKNQEGYTHELIDVQQFNTDIPRNHSTVCVRPLFGPFNDEVAIMQFLIYYKYVLKVDRFIFYKIGVTGSIQNLFRKLKEKGENIELLNWNEPTQNHDINHDYGAITSFTNCIYLSMNSFVVIVDIDEFILPTMKNPTIPGIYHEAIKAAKGKLGDGILILNRYFSNTRSNKTEIPILENFWGNKFLNLPKERSKTILFASSIVVPGAHFVGKFVNNFKNKNIPCPETVAVLNHYRQLWFGWEKNKTGKNYTSMLRWKTLLENSELWNNYVENKFQ